jgi:hypothetical protein
LLLIAAIVASGILAGTVIDRIFVGGPAWQVLGAASWVEYSRHADLGPGLVAYPLQALAAAFLLIAAAVSMHRDGRRGPFIPLLLGIAFSLAGLLLTLKAAPIMLGIENLQPLEAQRQAFRDFYFWGLYLRGTADILAFLAAVWTLARLD